MKTRLSRESHPRENTGRECLRRGRRWWRRRWFYARFISPDTATTCARDGVRDDTAPYWTALRKYNGAPLLRYVHPNLGVGATPLPRSAVCVSPLSRLVRRSPLLPYPFIFRPPLFQAILRNNHPLIPPAPSRHLFSHPLSRSSHPCPLFLSRCCPLFFFRRGHHTTLDASPEGSFLRQRDTSATARFRCTSMATSVHARWARRDAKGSFLALSRAPLPHSP